MKRILAILLSAMLLLSLAACTQADTSADASMGAEQPTQGYVSSEDIEVAVAFVDEKAKVVTRRTSDKELFSVELVCVYFDAEGKQLGQQELVACTFLTKGLLNIWSFTAPEGCVYMDAAVAAVTYTDGTKIDCDGVSEWAANTVKAFTVENYEKHVAEMSANEGASAQACEYVECSVESIEDNMLNLKMKNNGGQDITEAIICLLWFDENGAPIDMEGTLVSNSEKISATDLLTGKEATYVVSAPEGAASAKAVVQEITFADETLWENIYVYEWCVANWASAK